MNRSVLLLILFSALCVDSCEAQKTVNGFTQKYERIEKEIPLFSLPFVNMKNKYSSSGAFIQLIHANGRELDLFVPTEKEEEINVQEVIKTIEFNNNPNTWSFYYTPFGVFNIDSVLSNGRVQWYDNYKTIIEQNELFSFEEVRKKGYVIRMKFVKDASFCIVETATRELNNYNSRDKLQDGSKERKSETPTYLFSNNVNMVPLLLPKSTFCE